MGKHIDLAGKSFGELTVVRDTGERHKNGSYIWECKCSCGKIITVPTHVLKGQKSCGCKARRLEDLTGRKFGKLTAISISGKSSRGRIMWDCICDCGNETIVSANNLKSSQVISCGCAYYSSNKTHGMSNTKLYDEWTLMKYRCSYKGSSSYKNYGARGITVCKEWLDDFMNFYNWAMKNGYREGLSLERKDVNGNYCPENCCWIEKKEQANNKTTTIRIEYNGKIQNLKQWCDELGMNYKRVHNRMNKLGYSFEEAITKPVMKQRRNKKARNNYGIDS